VQDIPRRHEVPNSQPLANRGPALPKVQSAPQRWRRRHASKRIGGIKSFEMGIWDSQ
jgi:hypothetical protein